jgi:hypothetical protein
MADMGFTPELVASGNIFPFRFVKISGAFQGAQCLADEYPVGVTDGSIFSPTVINNSTSLHASSGRTITLQPSNTVQIECGASVTAGAYLESDADGKGVPAAGAAATSAYIALEAGAAGEIIRAWRFGYRGPIFT